MDITNNDKKILLKLFKNDGVFRKEAERSTQMNRQSFHLSLMRLILNGFVKVEQVKGKGNPTKLHITEDGKTMANAFKEIE